MSKITNFAGNGQHKQEEISLSGLSGINDNRPVTAVMEKMSLSSFGGITLLREEDGRLGLSGRLASCIDDRRTGSQVRHSQEEIIMMRLFMICLGYEDANDCNAMRDDPLMQLAINEGRADKRLCSQPTMTRFENMANIRAEVVDDKGLYETTYCKRGNDELYIRQFKEAVSGDRLSCHSFKANRLRIFIHAAAYMLLWSIRHNALSGTSLRDASLTTVREKLLIFAVNVKRLKTKIVLEFAKHHPLAKDMALAMRHYSQLSAA